MHVLKDHTSMVDKAWQIYEQGKGLWAGVPPAPIYELFWFLPPFLKIRERVPFYKHFWFMISFFNGLHVNGGGAVSRVYLKFDFS